MLWDRELALHKERIDSLPKSQGMAFAIGCVDRSMWRFDLDYQKDQQGLRSICRRFASFLAPATSPIVGFEIAQSQCLELIDEVQLQIDHYENRESDQACLYLSYSILYTLYHELDASNSIPSVCEIGAYAYQYTWYQFVYIPLLPQLRQRGGALGSDIELIERECQECIADIRYQLAIADAILVNGRLTHAELTHRY